MSAAAPPRPASAHELARIARETRALTRRLVPGRLTPAVRQAAGRIAYAAALHARGRAAPGTDELRGLLAELRRAVEEAEAAPRAAPAARGRASPARSHAAGEIAGHVARLGRDRTASLLRVRDVDLDGLLSGRVGLPTSALRRLREAEP